MYSSDGNSYPAKETSSSHSPSKKSGYFVAPGLLLLITCFLNSFGFAILLSNEEEEREEEEEEKAFDPSLSNAPSLPPSENARASPPPLTAAAKDVAHSAIDDDDVNNTVLLDALSSFHFLFFFSSSSSPVSSSEEEEELRQKRRAIPVLTTSECRRRRRCRDLKAGARLVRVVAVVVVTIYPAYYFVWYSGAFFSPGKRGIKSHARKERVPGAISDDIARTNTRARKHTRNEKKRALSLSRCPRTVLARRQRPGTTTAKTTKTVLRKIKSSVDGNTITWRRETRSRAVKKPRRRSKSVAARRRRGAVAAARRPWRKKSEAKISLRESWNALKTLWRSWRIA
jgi:hypothetical protein